MDYQEWSEEQINGHIEDIETEIKHFNDFHTQATHEIEAWTLPISDNEDATTELEDLLHDLQFGLKPILDAIETLRGEIMDLAAELDERGEREHERQESHQGNYI